MRRVLTGDSPARRAFFLGRRSICGGKSPHVNRGQR